MSSSPTLSLVCGIDTLPLDASGYPLCFQAFSGRYPCYVPNVQVGPFWEWSAELRVPLPETHISPELRGELWPRRNTPYGHALYSQMSNAQCVRRRLLDHSDPEKGSVANEVLYWHDRDTGLPQIVGYTIGEMHANDFLYALISCFPDLGHSGYRLVPSVPLEESESVDGMSLRMLVNAMQEDAQSHQIVLSRSYWKTREERGHGKHGGLRADNRKKNQMRNQQNYHIFQAEFDPIAATTMHLFNWMGLHVRKCDLRLMLCWTWG